MEENMKIKEYTGIAFSKYFNADHHNKETMVYEKYKKKQKEGKPFPYHFDVKTESADDSKRPVLYSLEDGVRIEFCPFNSEAYGRYGTQYRITSFNYAQHENRLNLENEYYVKVKKIDRKNKVIYLADHSENVDQMEQQCRDRDILVHALCEGIERKEYLRVPARIIGFTGTDRDTGAPSRTIAVLDIGNLGIIGSIRVAEWSIAYTRKYTYCAAINEEIEVVVRGNVNWGGKAVFDCSRKLVLEQDGIEPWKDIEQRIPEGALVRVTCIDSDRYANKFFGKIEGVPELNVYLENPYNEKGFTLTEGSKYMGVAYKVSEQDKLLRVRIKSKLN